MAKEKTGLSVLPDIPYGLRNAPCLDACWGKPVCIGAREEKSVIKNHQFSQVRSM
jgi:hypothetical protein